MQIALNDVLKEDGKVLRLCPELGLDAFDVKNGKYPITQKSPVSLVLTNKGRRKLFIQGKAELIIRIPCGRCLEDVPVRFSLDFGREVDMNLTEEERRGALDECAYIHGYDLDVDELVYSEILVNWPLRVLCKEDCKGICSICGKNLNHGACGCDHTDFDPRMAQIRDIFNKFKEV